MRRTALGLGVVCAVASLWGARAHAEAADARDLVRRAVEALPKGPFLANLKLTATRGQVRQLTMAHKFVQGARASYLEVTAPDELKGIRFLFLERMGQPAEQYIKVAASRKSLRVLDKIRKQPFLGSSFYVSDLTEPNIDSFTYKFADQEELLGRACRLIESTPKNPAEEIYGKTVMAVDPKDLLVLRREFFDLDGHLLKVWAVNKVKQIDGNWTLRDQSMNNIQEQAQSRLEIVDIKYNVELADSMFTPEYLNR